MKRLQIYGNPVHPLSLYFSDRAMERKFRENYISAQLWQIQLAQILAILLYALAVLAELKFFNLSDRFAYLRLFVVVLSFGTGFLLTLIRTNFYKRFYRAFNIYFVLLTGLSFIHLGMNVSLEYSIVFYVGVFVCLVFNYSVIRQDFPRASVSGLVLLLAYILAVYSRGEIFPGINLITVYLIALNFLGMFIAYLIEYDSRKNFILKEQLEERVAQRTLALENARDKAQESDRLKSAFLANMSHEIRTPMNGILGFAGLLDNPEISEEDRRRYLEIINKSGERLLRTVNNLMDISKIESGNISPAYREVDFMEVLKTNHEFFMEEANTRGLELVLESGKHSGPLMVRSDPHFLESILGNLVKNALKFTHSGRVEIGLQKNENLLMVYVRDDGIGIPEDRQEAIFDHFVQADIEDKDVYEGSGIGLSITKSYVEMLGGRIWLKSSPGQGSTFYFTHPLKNLKSPG